MAESAVSFSIDTEVTPAYYQELIKYTYQNYVLPNGKRFTNVSQSSFDGTYVLSFTALDPNGKWHVNVEMKTGKPIQITMQRSDAGVPQAVLDRLREDLIIFIQYFEEMLRRSTLYFAWVEGKEVVPEKSPFRRARLIERILFGNILLLLMIMIIISIVLFLVIDYYAALVLVAGQFLIVIFADKLIGTMADWTVTEQNAKVHILQYHLPAQERLQFQQKYPREKLLQMKKEIYDKTIALGKPVECETAREVMAKHGLECSLENMGTKTVNVYQLVQETTDKFNLHVPKIALSNTMVPNAAASGPSPSHGIVLITTGLLVQLEEKEIRTVLGHELSHLKSRDPFVLSGIVSAEYLFRVFVLVNYFPVFLTYFGLFYILFILFAIYFVAKFFEARADLESAIKIGNPKVLAEALRKIGFRRLQFERSRAYRLQEWITWNPHPPLYFRIARLEKMEKTPIEVKHTLIQSAKDCIRGFFAAF
ncbi:MAG: M56 family metallopeptidase [Candidatus Bathyarchaeia archaeon]